MDAAAPHLACLFCTQNCYRTHGKGKPPGPSVPTFCKIMTESNVSKDTNTTVLELPAAFAERYGHELHKTVSLEGPSGQTWSVDVCRSKCSTSFEKGWHAFSVDHDLHEGDIAVFKLITRECFIVRVFGKDGCEKDLYSVQNSVALSIQSEIGFGRKSLREQIPWNILTERRYKHVKHENVANVSHVDVESKEASPNSENGHKSKEALQSTLCVDAAVTKNRKNMERLILKESSIQNTVDSDPDDLECHLQEFINRYKKCQEDVIGSSCMPQTSLKKDISFLSYKKRIIFGGRQRHDSNRGGSKTWPVKAGSSCMRLVSDAMMAAMSHCSNYPATIIQLKPSHVTQGFWLNLGKDFGKKWLPEVNTDGYLVNSAGRRWKVRWISKRAAFSSGWRRFSRYHGLQENDVCLLELTSGTPIFFMVHMFRHG